MVTIKGCIFVVVPEKCVDLSCWNLLPAECLMKAEDLLSLDNVRLVSPVFMLKEKVSFWKAFSI